MPENMSPLRRLNLIFRFSYTLAFLFASVCGIAFACVNYDVPAYIAVLVPLTVLFMALFVNFSNDYFDSVSGADDLRFDHARAGMTKDLEESPLLRRIYWDGNPVNNGMVSKEQARTIMAALVAVCILLSVPIILYGGWSVIALGAVGLLIAFFYTAPPVNLGARGLGEVAVGISFFLMVFASCYIASHGLWNMEIFVFSVLVGIFVGLMRLVDSMSGQDAHVAAGERSISVILGLDGMVPLIKAFIVIGYVIVAVMVCFDISYIVLFLTLPLASKGWRVMDAKEEYWEVRIAPMMFLTAFMTEVLFVAVQIIHVFFRHGLF